MTSNYIYLLQEREFVNKKESVYKIGRTKQENSKRIKQYPKGTVLLFQIICNDCSITEKAIISIFKEKFKHRKDIGNEYFEGNYQTMIDIIYSTIKLEFGEYKVFLSNENKSEENKSKEYEDTSIYKIDYVEEFDELSSCESENESDEEPDTHTVVTYEEWCKFRDIKELIITNKSTLEGYFRWERRGLWEKLDDANRKDYNNGNMRNLSDLFVGSGFEDIEFDYNKIQEDIIKKCYEKNFCPSVLRYDEYILDVYTESIYIPSLIFNSGNLSCVPANTLSRYYAPGRVNRLNQSIHLKDMNNVNIDIVNDIINSLDINIYALASYKKLVHSLIVEQDDHPIIFHDHSCHLLTTWIIDLLGQIGSHELYLYSGLYYERKKEYNKTFKIRKPRLVIITENTKKTINAQINEFTDLGFKNIIVQHKNKSNHFIYDVGNFRKYIDNNKERIIDIINEQRYDKDIMKEWNYHHDDEIFFSADKLFTNFLKWCCTK